MSPENEDLTLRTRMCLVLKDVPGCDAKLSQIVQSATPELDRARLSAAGILGEHIPPRRWLRVRYHVAVDGNSLAWSSTFTRFAMGCCILRPESAAGFEQWYTPRLVPWRHHVPVAADLGDLVDRIAWCRANPDEAAAIAERGRRLVAELSYERELDDAARRLDQALANGPRGADPRLVARLLDRRLGVG
jgi:hypothetical protein